MLLKKKDEKPKSLEIETHIGSGVWLEGEINSAESIRLDGFFKGNVTVSDTLVIGETGKVLGHIKAKNLLCAGKIQGDVDIDEVAEFISGGALVGDIDTTSLVMPHNVYFKGSCNMKNEVTGFEDQTAKIVEETLEPQTEDVITDLNS